MNHEPNDAIIVRSVIDLGHNLGLETVAEGIEDLDTWQQLINIGCDSAQGYFLAKPMSAADFGEWLQRRDSPTRPMTGLANTGQEDDSCRQRKTTRSLMVSFIRQRC